MICNISAKWILFLSILLLSVQTSGASAWVKINPWEGNVGTSFRITGGGFTPDSNIGIFFGDKVIAIAKTDLKGSFSLNVEVPEISCGFHKVMAVDEVKNNAYMIFNVTPKITKFSSKEGRAGSTVTITGKGFSADSEVELILANFFDVSGLTFKEVLASKIAKTNEKGTFEVKFEIPDVAPGYYLIYAYDPKCGVETEYTKFEVLEPKLTPTATPTPKITVVQNEMASSGEVAEFVPTTASKTPTIIKTPTLKKQTPGFELVIAFGGIAIALLVSRKFK